VPVNALNITIWDTERLAVVHKTQKAKLQSPRTVNNHRDYETAISNDGRSIAMGFADGYAIVWDTIEESLTQFSHVGVMLCFSTTNDRLGSFNNDGTVTVRDLPSCEVLWQATMPGRFISFHKSCCALTSDLFVFGQSRVSSLIMLNARNGEVVKEEEIEVGGIISIASSSDEDKLALGYKDGTIAVLRSADGSLLVTSAKPYFHNRTQIVYK
jgi:WD40 repeat protein